MTVVLYQVEKLRKEVEDKGLTKKIDLVITSPMLRQRCIFIFLILWFKIRERAVQFGQRKMKCVSCSDEWVVEVVFKLRKRLQPHPHPLKLKLIIISSPNLAVVFKVGCSVVEGHAMNCKFHFVEEVAYVVNGLITELCKQLLEFLVVKAKQMGLMCILQLQGMVISVPTSIVLQLQLLSIVENVGYV